MIEKEDIVSLETAREAFRKGFDEPTEWGYDWDIDENNPTPTRSLYMSSYKNTDFWKGSEIGRNIAAPSKKQYEEWLKKKK